jgi:hypothetical protein
MNKLACFFVLASCAAAQEPDLRLQFDWSKLAAKAVEKVDLNLEGPMLEMASKFLSGDKNQGTRTPGMPESDEAKIKQMVQGLKGIYVKSFTFDKEGQYSDADVSALRSQLRPPEWSNVLDVQEKHESTGIYLRTNGKQFGGFALVSAEPKELTVVQIIGPIDPSMLSDLGGKFGFPKMELGPKPKPKPTTKKDD